MPTDAEVRGGVRRADPAGVRLIVLDVDGVLTDGSVYLDDRGVETKRFNIRDGLGLRAWQRLGFGVAVLTGRTGPALRHRLSELGIGHVKQGSKSKGPDLRELLETLSVRAEEAAYIGDDWPDLPAMRGVGYPIAVADAEEAVIGAAAYVTKRRGGRGAVRDAVEHLLEAKGLMELAVGYYTEA